MSTTLPPSVHVVNDEEEVRNVFQGAGIPQVQPFRSRQNRTHSQRKART